MGVGLCCRERAKHIFQRRRLVFYAQHSQLVIYSVYHHRLGVTGRNPQLEVRFPPLGGKVGGVLAPLHPSPSSSGFELLHQTSPLERARRLG